MNYDMSSYFEDPEFKEALAKYEGMVESPVSYTHLDVYKRQSHNLSISSSTL